MANCPWCQKNNKMWDAALKVKGHLNRSDYVYAPTFILDGGNEHLPEPGIGSAELRAATPLRRWVHDLRDVGGFVVQCLNGDALDNLLGGIADAANQETAS